MFSFIFAKAANYFFVFASFGKSFDWSLGIRAQALVKFTKLRGLKNELRNGNKSQRLQMERKNWNGLKMHAEVKNANFMEVKIKVILNTRTI